jgi:hypothetical protein
MSARFLVPVFPDKVRFNDSQLIDEALDQSMKVNYSATELLSLVDGHKTISEIAKDVAERNNWNLDEIEDDFFYQVLELNQEGLLNIRKRISPVELLKNVFLTIYFSLFFPFEQSVWIKSSRWDIPLSTNYLEAIHAISKALLKGFLWFWIILLVTGIFGGIFISAALLALSVIVFTFMVAGTVCHEFFHYWVCCQFNKGKCQGFILVRGTSFYFYRQLLPPSAEFWVSLMGPLTPCLLGVSLLFVSLLFRIFWLEIGSIFLLLQGVTLIPWAEDGKKVLSSIWRVLQIRKTEQKTEEF